MPATRAFAKLGFELGRATGEGGVDDIVERQRRSVRHHRDDVVDADHVLTARVERELGDFAARCGAVAAEQRDQHGARVRRKLQAGVAHFVVDQPRAVFFAVGVAGQRRGILRVFNERTQRRVAAQIAGLDDDAAFECR